MNEEFYILQNFLPGEIKASWNNLVNFTPLMRERLFSMVAQFSRAVEDFQPQKQTTNKTIPYYVDNFEDLFNIQLQKISASPGKVWLQKHQKQLIDFAQKTKSELERIHYSEIPKQCVHFDMHPGNVHFDEQDNII
jgi:Ser/Thr protein kinase RdoA (MazF antagonist)